MIQTKKLTGQRLYVRRLLNGQLIRVSMVYVLRCKQHRGTFCDRNGMTFYDLKTTEKQV